MRRPAAPATSWAWPSSNTAWPSWSWSASTARSGRQSRLRALDDPARQLTALIDTVRAAQRIDAEELAGVRAAADKERRVIATQRARLEAALRNTRPEGAAPDSAAQRQARWDRDTLASLTELDAVVNVVMVGGVSGTVGAIDLRATTLRGFDGIQQILPSSYLLENLVGDWSQGPEGLRTELRVPVAYGTDSRAAAALIQECARALPQVLATPAPEVLLDDFAAYGPVFKLWIWTALGGTRAAPLVASDLCFAIDRAFTERGIAPPVTRHDVTLAPAAQP